jgi:hypothetical protein
MIPEMVFLLQRVGNIKKALELIITELGDVTEAIDFCKEVNDDELWTDLIQRSLSRPDFILGLLNNTGTHINPMRLISMIPTGMRIPGLRGALVKILQDFSLQCELRKGCQTILSQDAVMLHRRLVTAQKRGYRVDPGNHCPLCNVTDFANLGSSGRSNRMVSFLCCEKQYCLKCIEGMDGGRRDLAVISCPVCSPKKKSKPGKRA